MQFASLINDENAEFVNLLAIALYNSCYSKGLCVLLNDNSAKLNFFK